MLRSKRSVKLQGTLASKAEFENSFLSMFSNEVFNKQYFVDRFGEDSNEVYWWKAKNGDKQALSILYERTKMMWSKCPNDPTCFYDVNDWKQIAALRFLEVWHLYEPARGYKFSTFICTAILNNWRNETRALTSTTGRHHMYRSQYDIDKLPYELQGLLCEAFAKHSDDEFVEVYLQRFRAYLESNYKNATLLTVFDHFVLQNKQTISDSAQEGVQLGMSLISYYKNLIKTAVKQFVDIERIAYEC